MCERAGDPATDESGRGAAGGLRRDPAQPQDGTGGGLVVDVANVVGSRPDGWWRDRVGATQRLLTALAAAADADPGLGPVVAVVEGRARAVADAAGIEVVRAAGSGDDAVVEQARRRPSATVVTADRGLRARLPGGTAVTGPGTLWRLLERPRDT